MRNNKVKYIINIFIILMVLCLVLYFSLKDDYQSIVTSILNMNIIFVFLAILLVCIYRILVGVSIYDLAVVNQESISLLKCIQISFIILFFHGVTPFAGGGQPMEIYYLHKEKISITKATNIVLQNFIVYQISLVVVGFFALVYNYFFTIFPSNSLIKKLVVLGFTINLLVLIVSYVFSFGKKVNKYILNKGLSLVSRLKIVKDTSELRKKLNTYLHNFHENALQLKQNRKEVIFNIFINIIAILSLYTVPYVVLYGLGCDNISVIEAIVSTAYVMTIGSFVPIPGGTGGVEYGFVFFFGHLIQGSILNASMLVWRFITYYLGMILGAIALSLYRKREKECE